ncbi:MAG: hypothetical protein ACRBCI_05325 [Cellvibrionaceae bacterium]
MADAEEKTSTEESPEDENLKKEKRKKIISHVQVVGLVFLLFSLMTTSVVTALMATGIIDISPAASGPANSMTDAQLICDKALQTEHGDKLQMFSMDDLSSHSDGQKGGYKLYYEMNMFRDASRRTGVDKFYVNCFVSASGRIKQMDLLEEKSYVPKAGRRTKGNAFGL